MINQEYLNYLYDKKFEAKVTLDALELEKKNRQESVQDGKVPYEQRQLINAGHNRELENADVIFKAAQESIEKYVSFHQIK